MIQLVTFKVPEGVRTGMMTNGKIYQSRAYHDMLEVLADWSNASTKLATLGPKLAEREDVKNAELVAPLPAPRNIYFAGANYKDHVEEMRERLKLNINPDPKGSGEKPWHSLKATGSSVVGPGTRVALPGRSKMLDWEVELAVVIGKPAKDVSRDQALGHVAGYTVANDLSARDHIFRPEAAETSPFRYDWIGQKSFDGSCPMGPAITPAQFIGDPMNLGMKLWVNGRLKQDSNTNQMLFDIADQISHLSSRVTLLPGDVVLTGTPAGVGMPNSDFLKPGDIVKQWIENIGEFEFTIA